MYLTPNLSGEPADDLAHEIHLRLEVLEPTVFLLHDESAAHAGHAGAKGGGKHFRLTIASAQFAGLSTVARHRKVFALLGDLMHQRIHAMALTTRTPDEAT